MALGPLIAFDRWQRQRRVTAVPVAVVKKFGEDGAGNLAALVAYYSFLSVFPLLLVFLTVVNLATDGNPQLRTDLIDSAFGQFPVVGDQLRSNVAAPTASGLTMAIGLLVSIWAGMGATLAMQDAMNVVWRVPQRRRPGFVAMRLRAMGILLLIAAFVVLSVALGSIATTLSSVGFLTRAATLLLGLAVNVFSFAIAFRLLTVHRTSWRERLPGAILAGLAWTILQSLGAFYVERVVRDASQTYGAFAVVLGLLAYLYLLAQITLYSAELNTVLARRLWPRSLLAERPVAADVRSSVELTAMADRLISSDRGEEAHDSAPTDTPIGPDETRVVEFQER